MPELTPRRILDAIHEGLMESALLAALGYDPSQGRPGRALLNNALERRGYGRPIGEQGWDRKTANQPYPDEWIRTIAGAVLGRPEASISEVIAALKNDAPRRSNAAG
jgi:hypothetical protein